MEAILEAQPIEQASVPPEAELGGKYLTFMLNDEEFGIEILKVREIIGVLDITQVPQTTDYVRGVVNLRGKVIPVIDLRTKFKMPPRDYDEQTCIIVVDVGAMMGVIVDTVQEVRDIPADHIQPPPRIGRTVDASFIRGMGKVNDNVKILLDIDTVLNSHELVISSGTIEERR